MIGTKIVKILDKEYEFRYSIKALMKIQEMTKCDEFPKGIEMSTLINYLEKGEFPDLKHLVTIAYCGLINADMTLDEFTDMVDSDSPEKVGKMLIMIFLWSVGAELPEESKKK